MGEELAAGDQSVDAGNVHLNDAARTDVEVTYFAVAHLAVGQANEMIGRMQQSVRIFRQQLVIRWLACQCNCVVFNLRTITPSVQNRKDQRPFVNRQLFLLRNQSATTFAAWSADW